MSQVARPATITVLGRKLLGFSYRGILGFVSYLASLRDAFCERCESSVIVVSRQPVSPDVPPAFAFLRCDRQPDPGAKSTASKWSRRPTGHMHDRVADWRPPR